jgi:hypothetical protein
MKEEDIDIYEEPIRSPEIVAPEPPVVIGIKFNYLSYLSIYII